MKLSVGELITIDATIIVGLLILLTFSSVSSPFIQDEQSTFFTSWYTAKQDLKVLEKNLIDCSTLLRNETRLFHSYDNAFPKNETDVNQPMVTRGDEKYFESTGREFIEEVENQCAGFAFHKTTLSNKIEVLNNWGLEFQYLEINPITGNMVESKYHKNLASGPFTVNMVNLGMIFPFLISAIAEALASSRNNKEDQASKIGKSLMILGFVAMVIGLSIIAFSYYEASAPFLKNV